MGHETTLPLGAAGHDKVIAQNGSSNDIEGTSVGSGQSMQETRGQSRETAASLRCLFFFF